MKDLSKRKSGSTVETKWVKKVKDLSNYDTVAIDSAIQYDRWMPEATEFVKNNQITLSKMPVAYFFTCLVLSKGTKKAEHQAKAYSDRLYTLVPQVKPICTGQFAGVLDYSRMSFFSRLITKCIMTILRVKENDYRSWDVIQSWATGIHSKLLPQRESSMA